LIPVLSSQRSCSVAGPVRAIKPEGAAHHVLDFDAAQRLAFIEHCCEQHGKGGLIELNAFPIGFAAEPLVLIPVAVLELCCNQIPQGIACFLLGPERQ
jgi:hypothetical protein